MWKAIAKAHTFSIYSKRYLLSTAQLLYNINAKQSDAHSYSEKTLRTLRNPLFVQDCPILSNPFTDDFVLQRYLERFLPSSVFHEVRQDLEKFGNRIPLEIAELGFQCEKQPPYINSYTAWGQRIDKLWTSDAWKRQRQISAEEGIVAIGYERKFSEWSRLYQFAKLYLYSAYSGVYSCPLAMTDGAARTIELTSGKPSVLEKAYERLTTRNAQDFWTSGQWMTERRGGSDIANATETIAIRENGIFKLYGHKWFTSAIDSDIALTLARVVNEDGSVKLGSSGLTLFYLETRTEEGNLNNIQMIKLKDKLGTRALPTAEITLDGTSANQISEEGCGVSKISNMLTLTRIYNGIGSVSAMRKALRLARDYSQRRDAFGIKIGHIPLHFQTLSRLDIEIKGSLLLLLKVAIWLGEIECGNKSKDSALLLRLMTPVLKLYTGKQVVPIISECLESMGGQGYIEDTGFPVILRDAQVLPIWEGTTNVLSLDVLRSINKTGGCVLDAFLMEVLKVTEAASKINDLKMCCMVVRDSAKNIVTFSKLHKDLLPIAARDFAFSIARTFIGALLLDNASTPTSLKVDITAAQRWCNLQDLCLMDKHEKFCNYISENVKHDFDMLMEGYII